MSKIDDIINTIGAVVPQSEDEQRAAVRKHAERLVINAANDLLDFIGERRFCLRIDDEISIIAGPKEELSNNPPETD